MSEKTKRRITNYLASSFLISLLSFTHLRSVFTTYYSTYARNGVFDFNGFIDEFKFVQIFTLFVPVILFVFDILFFKIPIMKNKRSDQ